MTRRTTVIVVVAVVAVMAVVAGLLVLRSRSAGETVLLPAGSLWRYNDSGKDPGIAWRQADYDDAAWAVGLAPLGYGQVVTTTVGFGDDPADKHLTTYFRTTFESPGPMLGVELRMRRDDGAVVYINGTEVLRSGMPKGDVTAGTPARYTQGDGASWIDAEIAGTTVAEGPNVVAVEVHHGHRRALLGEAPGDALAEAAAGARHQRHLACQPSHCLFLLAGLSPPVAFATLAAAFPCFQGAPAAWPHSSSP